MSDLHPAEELFDLRTRIRRLQAREAELRQFFLERAQPQDCLGPAHRVSVSRARRADCGALPLSRLADPRFWRRQNRAVVRVSPLGPVP